MKVLFLDHQGVMFLKKKNFNLKLEDFDKTAISNLNSIIKETSCEIVVSSDWNKWVSLDEMSDFYIRQGIVKKPIDYALGNYTIRKGIEIIRSIAILDWLNVNEKVTNWVCVDDLDLRNKLTNFVLVEDTNNGINSKKIIDEIIGHLK